MGKQNRWPQDTLWGTGYKFEKLYCNCEKCMAATNAASRAGKQKHKKS